MTEKTPVKPFRMTGKPFGPTSELMPWISALSHSEGFSSKESWSFQLSPALWFGARLKNHSLSNHSSWNSPSPLFLSENPETYQYSVLDGAQRLRAAISYLHGEYALTGLTGIISANEMHFDALPIRMQRHLRMSTMRAVIISSASSSKIQAEVFFRLNTGGTALTTQELRNATHQGPFNTLTVELSRLSEFRRAIGAGPSSTGNLRDVELILRYFVLSEERGQEYTISQRAFTDFLQRKNESSPSELERYRTSFVKSLNKCLSAFEGETFRRWRPEVGKSDSRFSVPLYDAQMLAVQEFSSSQIFRHAHEIRLGMRKLFTSEEFKNSLKMTTVHSLDLRVSSVVEMIESVAR